MSELIPIAVTDTVKTTCAYCGVGCGVDMHIENGQIIAVEGDKNHPANYGRLCVKGASLHETQYSPERLHTPLLHGKETDWDTALNYSADKFRSIIETHGPEAVAFYVSGQILTEDYYVANKLMKGFIGAANIDTNSRLCMASAVVAHKRAFGEDIVPGCYEDLEQTDVLILVGSNMAYTHPVTYQRVVHAKKLRPNMKVVVIDPRRTPTCDLADIHLAIKPGSDAFLFNGLLTYLAANEGLDKSYINKHCNNFDEALSAAQVQVANTRQAAALCDVDEDTLQAVYRLFAESETAVTVFSQGINQSSSGVDKGNAIINCHLATGKIGKVGATPFSITGQPNAMGGREVGGLANQLAAHMNFGDAAALDRVQRFWDAPNMAQTEGLKAVDMFDAVHSGKIKAIWIVATNPVVTMPNANLVREALRRCELVMVSDCIKSTDTVLEADVVFPCTTWGEKTGTVTNSERCISLQKGMLNAPAQAKPDWQVMALFAQKLGFGDAFNYQSVADVFREHAALSGFENKGERAFDISALATMPNEAFNQFPPTRWPIDPQTNTSKARMFEDGVFYTSNKKANFVPIVAKNPYRSPKNGQFIMNTGRVRDQWHTMNRTGNAAKLWSHSDEAFISINTQDAKNLGISQGDIAELSNLNARYLGRVNIGNDMRAGEVFVPMHWNNRFAASSRVNALVYSVTDPLCGQPEFKHVPVKLEPYKAAWYGFMLSTQELPLECDYWSKILAPTGFKYRLADTGSQPDWSQWLREQYPHISDWVEFTDSSSSSYRAVGFVDGVFVVALHISNNSALLKDENQWFESQLGQVCDPETRFIVLAGANNDGAADCGKTICSCYQVGEKTIVSAIEGGLTTAEALGETLDCGTNCGSCIPEINTLIETVAHVELV